MRYADAIQSVDTEKALSILGFQPKKEGAYVRFIGPCGHEVVIRCYGEEKNLIYCPECKKGSNIFQLALETKGVDYADLVEKTSKSNRPIENKLSLNYELEWCAEMEKEGFDKELCERLHVGRPKGKAMLSGCIAFTVHNGNGLRIAYYGIRIVGGKPIIHKSFNPEFYLFGYHLADQGQEVTVPTDMFSRLRHLTEGKQALCNFGLPYLSQRQMELLSAFPLVSFEWFFEEKADVMLNVAQHLKTYHRFV
jgi:hypothetical protein